MKHGSKKILALSISFLAIILFISPFIVSAECFTKQRCMDIDGGSFGMCDGYDQATCERNSSCCMWSGDTTSNNNTTNTNTTETQNNNQSQITGTIWQGARTEAVVQQSDPLVFVPQVGLPGFMERYVFNENSTAPIAKLMKAIFSYGIQVISFITLIVIIIGGFLWSIAGGNSSKVTEAKQWIFSGLGGLVLLMFSYLILRTINVDLVNFRTRGIDAITTLNLIVAEKSNQEQAIGDQGFLDRTYGESICEGGSPDREACCIYYNENTAISLTTDKLSAFSLAYCEQNGGRQKAINKCLEFGRTRGRTDGEGNARGYVDNIQERVYGPTQFYNRQWNSTTQRNPGIRISEWTKANYERQQSDLGLYFIKGKACWNFASYIADATIGLDNPNYCSAVDNNGWACIVTNNNTKSWGYCKDNLCQPCSSFGGSCSHDYQCPNRKEMNGNSTVVNRWQCGNGGLSGLTNNAATCDGGLCECANEECRAECSDALTAAGQQSRIEDVCEGN